MKIERHTGRMGDYYTHPSGAPYDPEPLEEEMPPSVDYACVIEALNTETMGWEPVTSWVSAQRVAKRFGYDACTAVDQISLESMENESGQWMVRVELTPGGTRARIIEETLQDDKDFIHEFEGYRLTIPVDVR